MNKKDMFLAAVLLLAAFLLFLVLRPSHGEIGRWVRISVGGKLYGTYPLFEERKIPVMQGAGMNIIRIQDGEVWVEEADCPDGYCIRQGKIAEKNQIIVCLPHQLVVEVIGENGEETGKGQGGLGSPDAVVH